MTSALIIILGEVVEAMLIISLLMAATGSIGMNRGWIVVAILIGLAGAGLYADYFDAISDAFDGVGQELTNATTLFGVCLCLMFFSFFLIGQLRPAAPLFPLWVGIIALFGSIGLAITREVVEIYIYISGYLLSPEPVQPILIGGALGTGIALSMGALIYYAVSNLKRRQSLIVSCIVLVPISAGLVLQGVTYLMQADKLPAQSPLWDTSSLIPEDSVIGELLFSLFSYEATPTPLHVAFYVSTVGVMLLGMLLVSRLAASGQNNSVKYA
ncbi:MAG: FTR1 family protein [Gammaproteobacteria bacterium]|nr:FTR1 family protein [Pseudomonadales bacterium]MCP5345732.1 FTR1 family protein [Pseudomonadales bacterium]